MGEEGRGEERKENRIPSLMVKCVWEMCVNLLLANLSIVGAVREHGKPHRQVRFLPGCLIHITLQRCFCGTALETVC